MHGHQVHPALATVVPDSWRLVVESLPEPGAVQVYSANREPVIE